MIIRLSPLRRSKINSPRFDPDKALVVFYTHPPKISTEKPASLNTQIQICTGEKASRLWGNCFPGRPQKECKSSRSTPESGR